MNGPNSNTKGNLNLMEMSVDDLLALRNRITETLSSRVETERRDLESRLARLHSLELHDSQKLARGGRVVGNRAIVAPKYRNPDNHIETWSGRGRLPRWLAAKLKAGKKLRDFEIVKGEALKKTVRKRRPQRAK